MASPIAQKPADDSADWPIFYQQHIEPLWQNVQHHRFTREGVELHWVSHKVSEQAPLLIVSPGRIEATIKYQELVWELAQAGISCAIIDHRGQGQSQRLTGNPHQGHVDHFQDFVDDFTEFYRQLEPHFSQANKRWLIGHSMGGAIATLFCAQQQPKLDALLLSSPMFSINTGGLPMGLAKTVAGIGWRLNRWLAPKSPWYFLGMGDYSPVSFEKNELTHSRQRYQVFRDAYQSMPEVQLGGPTFGWLYEALSACEKITARQLPLSLPVTLFQAGADSVVTAAGQDRFCALNGRVEKITIAGAKHELMMEADKYRQTIIERLLTLANAE